MHCECKSHLEQAKSLKSQPRLCFASQAQNDAKKIEAELHMAVSTASSNVPLSFHDLLLPMIRKFFPDSKIAAKYCKSLYVCSPLIFTSFTISS